MALPDRKRIEMPVEDEPAAGTGARHHGHQIDDTWCCFVTRDADAIDRPQKVGSDFGTFRHIAGRIWRCHGDKPLRGLDQKATLRFDLGFEACTQG
jgi:hypothetical protein